MNKKQLILLFLVLAVDSTFLAGCSLNPFKGSSSDEQNHKKGELKITTVTPKHIYFVRTHAHQEGENLVVWDSVRLRYLSSMSGGHVDIEVLDSSDKVLVSVSEYTVPKVVHRSDAHGSVFKVKLPIVPPPGSRIQLTFHRPAYKKSKPTQH